MRRLEVIKVMSSYVKSDVIMSFARSFESYKSFFVCFCVPICFALRSLRIRKHFQKLLRLKLREILIGKFDKSCGISLSA